MKAHFAIAAFLLALLPHSHPTFCGEKESLKLKIKGMHCSSCRSTIQRSVQKLTGVESVNIDLHQGTVEVVCDSPAVRADAISRAIQRLGYKVASPDSAAHPVAGG
jgi:copper chaperone CopZ